MIRRFWIALCCLVGLMALVACMDVEPMVSESAPDETIDVVKSDEPLLVQDDSVLSAPTEDISLVGTTGRPQFLSSYTEW